MKATFDDLKYEDIDQLLCGFVTEGQKEELKFHFIASPNISFNDAMQILSSMTTHFLTAVINQFPDAKEDIYDAYNFMASSVLNNLIPEHELRKDLDEEAILAKQKEMIEAQYEAMSDEEKAKALDDIDVLRNHLAEKIKDDKKNS